MCVCVCKSCYVIFFPKVTEGELVSGEYPASITCMSACAGFATRHGRAPRSPSEFPITHKTNIFFVDQKKPKNNLNKSHPHLLSTKAQDRPLLCDLLSLYHEFSAKKKGAQHAMAPAAVRIHNHHRRKHRFAVFFSRTKPPP